MSAAPKRPRSAALSRGGSEPSPALRQNAELERFRPPIRWLTLAAVMVASALTMFLYELAKTTVFPHLSMWESHAITIGVTSAVATFAVHVVSARLTAIAELRFALARQEIELAGAAQQGQYLIDSVVADVPVAILACDAAGRLFLHNRAADDLFAIGAVTDSTSGAYGPIQLAVDVFLPDGVTPVVPEERPLLRALHGDLVTDKDFVVVKTGGDAITVRSSARQLVGQNGECLGAVSITQDISQRKKLERELAQAQKLEAIGQLSAGIAHEINTPTQFIADNVHFLQDSFAELLELVLQLEAAVGDGARGTVPVAPLMAALGRADIPYLRDEVPSAILQSLEGVERIAKIVGAMKEFSHPGVARTPLNLNRAIASTITVATSEWKYVAEVETAFDDALPLVPVMPGTFNQAILNIIVNAAHAIGTAGAAGPPSKGRITVSTRKIDEWAEIRIHDTGCGIPAAVLERIFDPFFTTKPIGKGTGQGLAIAHDVIVKKHGGSISVDSHPGSGTTFTLRLPLAAPTSSNAEAA
jgi:signal transduction histidine kinase